MCCQFFLVIQSYHWVMMLLVFKQLHKARMKEESFLVYSNESAVVGNGYKCSNRNRPCQRPSLIYWTRPSKRFLSQIPLVFPPPMLGLFKMAKWNALQTEFTEFHSLLSDFAECPIHLFLLPRGSRQNVRWAHGEMPLGFRWLPNLARQPEALLQAKRTGPLLPLHYFRSSS